MTTTSTPAVAFPPGDYLRDELDARGWTEVEFAEIVGRPVQAISQIINNRKEITPTTALEISEALGTSPELWLNLQATHLLHVARSKGDAVGPVTRRARMRSLVPIREMCRRGWLPDTDDLDVLETALCEMLEISSLDEEPRIAAAARRTHADVEFTPEQTAWLARVMDVASGAKVRPFDRDDLVELARDIPHRLRDPIDLQHLGAWLADVGVALVIEMPLRSSKIDGAVLSRTDDVPVVSLTTRWNRFDSFVFTLLHEIAHLTLGHVARAGVKIDEEIIEGTSIEGQESEANELAASWIFPEGLSVEGRINTARILRLADRHRVHPSLVIGRLQHEGALGWNQLRSHIPKVRPFLPELQS